MALLIESNAWTPVVQQERDLPQSPAAPETRCFSARQHGLAALALVALAAYASFVPFHFQALTLKQALVRFQHGLAPHSVSSHVDFWSNLIPFIAVGYLVLATFALDRDPRSSRSATAFLALLLCGLTSVALEFCQAFCPLRQPDIHDILAQFLGSCLGAAGWLCCGQRLTEGLRAVWTEGDARHRASLLLFAYVGMLILFALVPAEMSFRPSLAFGKVTAGFGRLMEGDAELGLRQLWAAVYLLPAGALAGLLNRGSRHRINSWSRALKQGLKLALVVEGLQLLVRTRAFQPLDVGIGVSAFVAGWWLCRTFRRHESSLGKLALLVGLLGAWFACVANLLHGQAVDFTDDFAVLADRARTMNWLPLAEISGGHHLWIAHILTQKALLFVLGGVLLAQMLPRRGGLAALVIACATAFALEAGQITFFDRAPSITVILVEASAAWLGFAIAGRLTTTQAIPAPMPALVEAPYASSANTEEVHYPASGVLHTV